MDAQALLRLRLELKESQAGFAARLEIPRNTLHAYETGRTPIPRPVALAVIAERRHHFGAASAMQACRDLLADLLVGHLDENPAARGIVRQAIVNINLAIDLERVS